MDHTLDPLATADKICTIAMCLRGFAALIREGGQRDYCSPALDGLADQLDEIGAPLLDGSLHLVKAS
jgi:hypothetical protein